MHTEVAIGFPVLYRFLLGLARVSGFLIFIPIPGFNAAPEASRIVLALALTVCIMPAWPAVTGSQIDSGGALLVAAAAQFFFGLFVGVVVSVLFEGFQIAAQVIALQAGYAYASTVDPNTQADSGVLQVASYWLAGCLFFSLGLDAQTLKALALSGSGIPPALNASTADVIVRLGAGMFTTAVRLSIPVIGFLLLLDISFAVLGKVHAQLQLLSLSFSVKMLAGVAMLAAIIPFFPDVLEKAADHAYKTVFRLLGA